MRRWNVIGLASLWYLVKYIPADAAVKAESLSGSAEALELAFQLDEHPSAEAVQDVPGV